MAAEEPIFPQKFKKVIFFGPTSLVFKVLKQKKVSLGLKNFFQ
jgi:hypothetical protein